MKRFGFFILCIALVSLLKGVDSAYAQQATATMELNPRTQTVTVGENVTVSIDLKSSVAKRVNSARVRFTFDASILEIVEPTAGTIFCSYPDSTDNYLADNSSGVLLVTGISSGTASCAFPELSTDAKTLATVVFKTKAAGTSGLNFTFENGSSGQSSYIFDTNSPPQFILSQPVNGQITARIQSTPVPQPPSSLGVESDFALIVGILLTLALLGFIISRGLQRTKNSRVVVG